MILKANEQNQKVSSQEIIKRISAKTFGHFADSASEDMHLLPSGQEELVELKSNIAQLKDVSLRLGFMVREVNYLINSRRI